MAKKKAGNESMKTLMNCTNTEFLSQANLIKSDVEEFIKKTKISEIRSKSLNLIGDEDDATKLQLEKKFVEEKWDKIFKACFIENPEMTMKIIAGMCFTTTEEIEKMSPVEITNLAILLLGNARINDFFTALKFWGLLDTES